MTPTETMLTKACELSAAHAVLCAEYYRRPRNARMNDLFCHVMNWTHYGLVMVNDCEYGESPRKAITQLDKDLGAVRKAHQKLSADSYVCKQLWRIREWQRRVAHRVTEDGAFEV